MDNLVRVACAQVEPVIFDREATLDKLASVDNVLINQNPALTNLGLRGLTTVSGDASAIQNNSMLPTCQAVALAQRVMKPVAISGNDDSGVCP